MNYREDAGGSTNEQVLNRQARWSSWSCATKKRFSFLGQAQRYYVDREYEKKGMALQKSLSIINELQSSLDFENGGQIARNLDRIYTYMSQKLLHGRLQHGSPRLRRGHPPCSTG